MVKNINDDECSPPPPKKEKLCGRQETRPIFVFDPIECLRWVIAEIQEVHEHQVAEILFSHSDENDESQPKMAPVNLKSRLAEHRPF